MKLKLLFYLLLFVSLFSLVYSCDTTLDVNSADRSISAGGESYDCVYVRSGYTLTVDYPLTVTKEMIVYDGGVVTHSYDGSTENYKLNVTVDGNLTIKSGGVIDVSEKGYKAKTGPGGGVVNGNFEGCGGAYGGYGGTSYSYPDGYTKPNGNIKNTFIYGSGGGGTDNNPGERCHGGRGGGAIFIKVSNDFVNNGTILSNGGNGGSNCGGGYSGGAGGGSGGGIKLDINTLKGKGNISANGGVGGDDSSRDGSGGSGGRISIYYGDISNFQGSINVKGGEGRDNSEVGSSGTVYMESFSGIKNLYIRSDKSTSVTLGTIINSSILDDTNVNLYVNSVELEVDLIWDSNNNIYLSNNSYVDFEYNINAKNMIIKDSNVLMNNEGSLRIFTVNFENMSVDANSVFSVKGQGYKAGGGPGGGIVNGNFEGSGAGYGGLGGTSYSFPTPNPNYGGVVGSQLFGSAGGGSDVEPGERCYAGRGGGVLILDVEGVLDINGELNVDGDNAGINCGDGYSSGAGGGAGGSLILYVGNLLGSGVISASGGAGGNDTGRDGSGGGGGRISNYINDDSSFSGSFFVNGGLGGDNSEVGGHGSIFECKNFNGLTSCANINGVSLSSDLAQNYSINLSRTINSEWNAGMLNWSDSSPTTISYSVTGLNPSTDYLIYEDSVNTQTLTSDGLGNLGVFSVNTTGGVDLLVIEDGYDPSDYEIVGGGSDSSDSPAFGFPFGGFVSFMGSLILLLGYFIFS